MSVQHVVRTVTLLLLLCPFAAADTGRRKLRPIEYDQWNAWSGFREGSSVKYEYETAGMKMFMTTVLVRREADKLSVRFDVEFNGNTITGQEQHVSRQEGGGNCPKCSKPHAESLESRRDSAEVAGRRLRCEVRKYRYLDCAGKDMGTYELWLSREVPGFLVRGEYRMNGAVTKQVCTAFEVK
jgi:hypothetical protein